MKEIKEPHTAEGAVFDHKCAICKHVLECQGKPAEVRDCLNFEERNGTRGTIQNDKHAVLDRYKDC